MARTIGALTIWNTWRIRSVGQCFNMNPHFPFERSSTWLRHSLYTELLAVYWFYESAWAKTAEIAIQRTTGAQSWAPVDRRDGLRIGPPIKV